MCDLSRWWGVGVLAEVPAQVAEVARVVGVPERALGVAGVVEPTIPAVLDDGITLVVHDDVVAVAVGVPGWLDLRGVDVDGRCGPSGGGVIKVRCVAPAAVIGVVGLVEGGVVVPCPAPATSGCPGRDGVSPRVCEGFHALPGHGVGCPGE